MGVSFGPATGQVGAYLVRVPSVRSFVFIPGAGGSAWVWNRVTRLLVDAGREAIAVDLPGDDGTAGLTR